MYKKAQVTLFVIIAILIIAIILLILWQQGIFSGKMASSDIAKVKSYIQDCLELKTQDAILFIARQGGYNTLPEAHINFLEEKTAYYWKDNQTLIPSIMTVESELASILDVKASECLKMPGYVITPSRCKSTFEIKDTVKALFECPATVQKGAATTQIKDFSIEVNAPVKKMLDVSNEVVNEYKKQIGYLCVECIDKIALDNNVTVRAVPITKEVAEPEHIWFLIIDKNIKFDGNVTWRFVVEL